MKLLIRSIYTLFAILCVCTASAQRDSLVAQYIRTYKAAAMAEMQRTGIPAAITLAQGIHESGAGQSDLVLSSNNHFGIKCKNTWTGRTVYHDDDARGECFRAYDSPFDSYKDHSDFLKANDRYAFLFQYDPTDYTKWAYGLKQAGYATNPKYPQVLIKLIEDNKLNDYTLLAMGKISANETDLAMLPAMPQPEQTDNDNGTNHQTLVRQTSNPAFNLASTYPTGIFSINNSKVVFALKGTSLLALAQKQQVSLPEMLTWNDMDQQQVLDQDQLVFLQKKQRKGASATHVVQAGETLWTVSQIEGIRLVDLLQFNLMSDNHKPVVGQILNLQSYVKATANAR